MKGMDARRNAESPRQTPGLNSSRPSGSEGAATVQRREDQGANGRLAMLQSSLGNQAVLQMLKSSDAGEANTIAPAAASSASDRSKMPPAIQAKMESSFGADFSDVRIHAGSPKASAAGALAYAQGSDIHFAPGQYNPDNKSGQRLLGHELAHVVQQKQGRVSPTAQLASGMPLNDNPALEREADLLGARAASAPEPGLQAIQRATSKGGTGSASSSAAERVIQRMPSAFEVKIELGDPKEHMKNLLYNRFTKKLGMSETLKQNSTHYRAFLQKLDDFDTYVVNERIGITPDEISDQLDHIMTLYGEVEKVSDDYIKHNNNNDEDNKVVYIRKLKSMIPLEKTAVRSAAAEYKIDPEKFRSNWKLITCTSLLNLTDGMKTGETDKGGINSVTFFQIGPNKEGVFKEDKDIVLSDKDLPSDATDHEKDVAFSEHLHVTKDALIDPKNAHMANRNIAMSRLDKLLGANVIAKAEFALYNSGSGIVKGSYMEKAKGKSGGGVLKPLKAEIESGQKESFDVNDPVFQRALSRLQLIDTLALQVDRHLNNFFIHQDSSGKVLGITGIDNDMAFGTQTNLESKWKEYPGLSRFADKELAERIIALKPEDLRTLMEDLLSPSEVDALITRLLKLQNHLKKESTRLLGTDEWKTVNEKFRKGDTSYGTNIDATIESARKVATNKGLKPHQSGK
ncbi:DUF4157 domain-containing protein [Paenibacillus sp. LHD-117]|uniref:eCIS core domain-containing protein n=1 Tax=Paenibacillus sp. LHD-117 TaxID=3071412 RepID=UPI0027DF2E69|nr:DUF4157 domain-containing protein [Paenibacillus sp. LHD-117]MDQ6422316.1 DUF4157 domain-containing protein [Paenibacillus sp. LHD-117]